ncbi:MAG: cobalamin-dependent protein, partial [Gemmatimonadetes bacterium]|nr:cobalamin-dependent protein [Gemmatimonadota bacterium]
MRVLLVNPPNNYFDVFEIAPPLGILALAAAVRQDGIDVDVLDFNLRGVADHSFVDEGFYEKALALIEERSPDVVGLTSMVVNSHLALELARRVKRADGSVRVVLGGTHFSAIAEDVLRLYPWIDFVVKGEGEIGFRALTRLLKAGTAPTAQDAPPNVAFRSGESIVSSHVKKPFESMDELPGPAYDLVDVNEYFRVNPERVMDYEPGRGCVYKCSFCYAPVHYGSGGQSKTVDRILEDMQRLQDMGA